MEEGDEIIECWCGSKGTYGDLFDDDCLPERCGGMGVMECRCGGDLCVCHNHGEVECFGCPDCEDEEDDFFNEIYSEDFLED